MRVAIADDAELFRAGVASLLSLAGFEVIASVASAENLLGVICDDPPDVAILDIRMPPTYTVEGLDAALHIRKTYPGVGILVLSQHAETTHVADLLSSGGTGYLLKERVADADELADALRRIHAGGTVVDPEVIALVLGRQRHQSRLEQLTVREREILGLIAEGRSNRAIQERLSLSPKTVETHVSRIFSKLDLLPMEDDNRRVLAVLAHLDAMPHASSSTPMFRPAI
jgi:DNA-binding NarL/FixJ family response regulator